MMKKTYLLLMLVILLGCSTTSKKVLDLSNTKTFIIHELLIDKSMSKDELILKLNSELDYGYSKKFNTKEDLKKLNDYVGSLELNGNDFSFPMAINSIYEVVLSDQNKKERYFILDYDSDSVSSEFVVVKRDSQKAQVYFGRSKEFRLLKDSLN